MTLFLSETPRRAAPRLWAGLLAGLALLAAGPARAQQAWFADQPLARAAAARLSPALRAGRALRLDLPALRAALRPAGAVLALPAPGGGSQRYRVRPVPVLAPALAARFPRIQTYEAQGLDDSTATARLDVGPAGFHAQVLRAGQAFYIDPAGDSAHAVAFDKRAAGPAAWTCLTGGGGPRAPRAPAAGQPNGAQLRTFRLAVACTPEYSLTQGNTVASVLAAVATSINRVSGVYERELAVRLVLVAAEDRVIFLSGAGAPVASPAYSNGNGTAMLGQNQTNLDRVIGPNNYDIGHVFSTAGSGIAYIGVACDAPDKAGGVSGQANPTGDGFDIDYVAHEIGHQLGATHSFNGTGGDCGKGNRAVRSAYEPGSGVTVMAYAGICAPENLAANSLPYFHSRSYDEILAFLGTTGTCAVATGTGNRPPVPVAGPGYRIPRGTPFALTGRAADPDGDALTYAWEEFDRDSVASPIASPTGNAPLFRPFAPSRSPTRTFPQLSDVVNNVQTIGELLPTYGRRLHFRFVARDNRAGGGGVDYDSTSLAVIGTAGPFVVRQPNAAGGQWQPGTAVPVAWDVAGTAGAPINAALVDILLSTDGGYTYPTVLLAGAPNTGAATVAVPANAPLTAQARVMVRAVGNVFFDISDQNFTIANVLAAQPAAAAATGASVFPNPGTGAATLALANAQRGPVALRLLDALGRPVWAAQAVKNAGTWQYPLDWGPLAAGVYYLRVAQPAGPVVLKVVRQ